MHEHYLIATYIGIGKISYESPPSLKKSIDITFINNHPVIF